MHSQSALLLGAHQDRRAMVVESLRAAGFVVVEAATVDRAKAVLRHFRFDVLAIDFCDPDDGLLEILRSLHTEHLAIGVLLSGPLLDDHFVGGLRAAGLSGGSNEPRAARIAPGFDVPSPANSVSRHPRGARATGVAQRRQPHDGKHN